MSEICNNSKVVQQKLETKNLICLQMKLRNIELIIVELNHKLQKNGSRVCWLQSHDPTFVFFMSSNCASF